MNTRIATVYNMLFPQLSRDIEKCRKVAKAAESSCMYRPSLKKHFESACENLYSDGFGKEHRMLVENIRDVRCYGAGGDLARIVARADSPSKLFALFGDLEKIVIDTLNRTLKCINNGKLKDLDYDENFDIVERHVNSFERDIHKLFMRMFSPKTSTKATATVQSKLATAGVREARLGDNNREASALLNAVEIASKHNDILPDRVFVSELLEPWHMTEAFVYTGDKSTLVMASQRLRAVYDDYMQRINSELEKSPVYRGFSEYFKDITRQFISNRRFSVDSPARVPMHEIGHLNQPKNLPEISFSELDVDDKITALKLTGYVASPDILPELFAELFAKIRISGPKSLTEQEKSLFQKIINGGFKLPEA